MSYTYETYKGRRVRQSQSKGELLLAIRIVVRPAALLQRIQPVSTRDQEQRLLSNR
jgi:hypothetical protein